MAHLIGVRTVLVTGATGFVGTAVIPALCKAGFVVRGLTRDMSHVDRTADVEWIEGDVDDAASLARALEGCDATLYLVHAMAEGGGFHARELDAARTFASSAERAGVRRIVYLGGMAPDGKASEHLQSRLDVGETLRGGSVVTVELRASMIVGPGSLSWLIVRDLAARLPVMLLPTWLKSRTQPVAIEDVVEALVSSIDLDVQESEAFDIPGPEILTGKDILFKTARALDLPSPRVLEVPFVTPRLSSGWVGLVTRAKWSIAREVVVGLQHDIIARDARFWRAIGHEALVRFDDVAARTVAAEHRDPPVPGPWGIVERVRQADA